MDTYTSDELDEHPEIVDTIKVFETIRVRCSDGDIYITRLDKDTLDIHYAGEGH